MIQKKSFLQSADNSGARILKCIGTLQNKAQNQAKQGTHIVVSVNRFLTNKKVRKGSIYHGSIIQTRFFLKRSFGHLVAWSSNRVIIFKKNDYVTVGSRITHFVTLDLRKFGLTRIVSLAIGTL